MRKIPVFMFIAMLILLIFSACGPISSRANSHADVVSNKADDKVYDDFIKQLGNNSGDTYYALKDIDGNGNNELIVLINTAITVYTFNDSITEIGCHDFITGTFRLLYSNNPKYPGILYFTVDGGAELYGYMTIENGRLSFEDLWEENYAAEPSDRIKEISTDKQLISESKLTYNDDKNIVFTLIE